MYEKLKDILIEKLNEYICENKEDFAGGIASQNNYSLWINDVNVDLEIFEKVEVDDNWDWQQPEKVLCMYNKSSGYVDFDDDWFNENNKFSFILSCEESKIIELTRKQKKAIEKWSQHFEQTKKARDMELYYKKIEEFLSEYSFDTLLILHAIEEQYLDELLNHEDQLRQRIAEEEEKNEFHEPMNTKEQLLRLLFVSFTDDKGELSSILQEKVIDAWDNAEIVWDTEKTDKHDEELTRHLFENNDTWDLQNIEEIRTCCLLDQTDIEQLCKLAKIVQDLEDNKEEIDRLEKVLTPAEAEIYLLRELKHEFLTLALYFNVKVQTLRNRHSIATQKIKLYEAEPDPEPFPC